MFIIKWGDVWVTNNMGLCPECLTHWWIRREADWIFSTSLADLGTGTTLPPLCSPELPFPKQHIPLITLSSPGPCLSSLFMLSPELELSALSPSLSLPGPSISCSSLGTSPGVPEISSSVQLSHSVVSDSLWPPELQHARPPCPSPTPGVYCVRCVSDAIQPSHPLSSPSPPALNLSQHQGLFKWVSSLHQVAKVLEFQFQHSPSNEHPGLISFRMDWLDLLAVQGTLKNLLQHHSSKASILQCSAFFIVQLSHPYVTTGKTIALTRRTFVGKVTSLLFNMLSRLVITFLCLLLVSIYLLHPITSKLSKSLCADVSN